MDAVWAHCRHVAWVDSEDRVVLLDLSASVDEPRILSDSGSSIWRSIDGKRDDAAIVDAIAAAYGLEPDEVRADVYAFLEELSSLGLVERT